MILLQGVVKRKKSRVMDLDGAMFVEIDLRRREKKRESWTPLRRELFTLASYDTYWREGM